MKENYLVIWKTERRKEAGLLELAMLISNFTKEVVARARV